MRSQLRLGELLVGFEGTALLRHALDGDDAFVTARLAAIRHLLGALDGDGASARRVEIPELDVDEGYALWADTYDDMANAMIRAEEPLVDAALTGIPPGRGLDAACGTGRLATKLAALGHSVVGVDRSPSMVAVARRKLPDATFRVAELTDLPVPDASMDVAVCGLSLTHVTELGPAIEELARVVRPGGSIVVSDAHPALVLLQGQALFPHDGGFAFIRNHVHLHSRYLAAFRRAGVAVLDCAEAPMQPEFAGSLLDEVAEAARSIMDEVPAVLVWKLERSR